MHNAVCGSHLSFSSLGQSSSHVSRVVSQWNWILWVFLHHHLLQFSPFLPPQVPHGTTIVIASFCVLSNWGKWIHWRGLGPRRKIEQSEKNDLVFLCPSRRLMKSKFSHAFQPAKISLFLVSLSSQPLHLKLQLQKCDSLESLLGGFIGPPCIICYFIFVGCLPPCWRHLSKVEKPPKLLRAFQLLGNTFSTGLPLTEGYQNCLWSSNAPNGVVLAANPLFHALETSLMQVWGLSGQIWYHLFRVQTIVAWLRLDNDTVRWRVNINLGLDKNLENKKNVVYSKFWQKHSSTKIHTLEIHHLDNNLAIITSHQWSNIYIMIHHITLMIRY